MSTTIDGNKITIDDVRSITKDNTTSTVEDTVTFETVTDTEDLYVLDTELQANGIQGILEDRMDGSVTENKKRFDQLATLVRDRYNQSVYTLDTRITSTEAQIRSDLNTLIQKNATALEELQKRLNGDELQATIGTNSPLTPNAVTPSDISYEEQTFGTFTSLVASDTNDLRSRMSTLEDTVNNSTSANEFTNLELSNVTLADLGVGQYYITNSSNMTSYTDVPTELFPSGKAIDPMIVKVYDSNVVSDGTEHKLVQEISRATTTTYNNRTYSIGATARRDRYYDSSVKTNKWGTWRVDGVSSYYCKAPTNDYTNSTHSIIRIGDIQICYGAYLATNLKAKKQSDFKITFPSSYAVEPQVITSLGFSPETNVNVSSQDVTKTNFTLSVWSNTNTRRALRWLSIGRWK